MSDYSYLWRSPIKPIDDFNQSFGSGVNKVGGIGDAVSSAYKTGKYYVTGEPDGKDRGSPGLPVAAAIALGLGAHVYSKLPLKKKEKQV